MEVRTGFIEVYKKKLEDIKKRTNEYTYSVKYEEIINKHFIRSVGAPGMEFINHQFMEKQRKAMNYIIKTAGKNIFSGKSIMNISLPVTMCDYRSLTEVGAYAIRNHFYFLEAGAEAAGIERMKLVVTNYISGLHFMMSLEKPFNSIIGETFQIKSGNSVYYAEQTSHHPPYTNFFVDNPKFKLYGWNGVDFHLGANSATGSLIGSQIIKYNDGSEYHLKFPEFYAEGMIFGKVYITFNKYMVLEDKVSVVFY